MHRIVIPRTSEPWNRGVMDASKVGSIVELAIERIVGGGFGIARAGGRTVFVSYAAPGDRVRARIDRVQGPVSFGTVVDVLSPGADRQEPPCPHFGSCGGCDLQHLTYQAQLLAKQEIVRDALRRIGGFRDEFPVPITASPLPWGYRARAEWRHDRPSGALGYFKRGSHAIEDVSVCYVLNPALERLRVDLRSRSTEFDAAELHAAGETAVTISPAIEGVSSEPVTVNVAGDSFRFDAATFFQANLGILPPMIDEVMKHSPDSGGASSGAAVDLFCGVGLFTLPLARRYARVVGVESDRRAVQYARGNARFAGLHNAKFAAMPVDDWFKNRAAEFGSIDLAVVDPPRIGLETSLIARFTRARPRRIAYVSCDPATLARDLKRFTGVGYRFESIAAFDMFPQNHHVEAVAHLVLAG